MILPMPGGFRKLTLFPLDQPTKTSVEQAIAQEIDDFGERLIDRARELARSEKNASLRVDHVELAATELLKMDLSQADETDHFYCLIHDWSMAPLSARKHFIGWLKARAMSKDD